MEVADVERVAREARLEVGGKVGIGVVLPVR